MIAIQVIGIQIAVAATGAVLLWSAASVAAMSALLYGSLLGVLLSVLMHSNTGKALAVAVDNPQHGMVVIFGGFFLRYAVAGLGLLAGFKVLQLMALPMLSGFVLMLIVQVFASLLARP